MNKTRFKKILLSLFSLIFILICSLGVFAYLQLENDSLLKFREDADGFLNTVEIKLDDYIAKEEKRNFATIEDVPSDILYGHFQVANKVFTTNFYQSRGNAPDLKKAFEKLNSIIATMNFRNIENEDLQRDLKRLKDSVKDYSRVPNFDGFKKVMGSKKGFTKIKGSKKSKKYIPIKKRQYDKGRYIALLAESGDLLLIRSVYDDGQKLLQGLVLNSEALFSSLFKKEYFNRNLSDYTSLRIWLGQKSLEWGTLERDWDYQYFIDRKMDNLISNLKLEFYVDSIPLSPSFKYLALILLIVLLVLIASFIFIYKSGLAQFELAEARSNFVSAVGHELKTPLTSISMYTEMLQEELPKTEEQKKSYYDFISQETQRLSRLINNILKLSKLNRNALLLNSQEVSSDDLAQLIRKKTSKLIESQDFTLNIQKDESIFEIDEELFIQVITNLIDNALKFSKDCDEKTIDITLKKNCFEIRDYGPGLSEEKLEKIFDMFYRGESELTRTTTGTGIGLSLVKQICDLHGAVIKARNADPGLSIFINFKPRKD